MYGWNPVKYIISPIEIMGILIKAPQRISLSVLQILLNQTLNYYGQAVRQLAFPSPGGKGLRGGGKQYMAQIPIILSPSPLSSPVKGEESQGCRTASGG
jgi:hypothetical protein